MTYHCWRCAAALPGPPPAVCRTCGQGHYANPKPAAEAVVVRDGRILLLERAIEPWRGCWDIPGGFCDAGEHPARTAERELREETGIVAVAGPLLGIWMDAYGEPAPDGLVETTMNVVYQMVPGDLGVDVALDAAEASASGWFALDAVPADLSFQAHAHAVIAAVRARA